MLDRLSGAFFAVFGVLLLAVVIPQHTEEVGYGWMRPQSLPAAMALVIAVAGLLVALRPVGETAFEPRLALRAGLYLGVLVAGVWLISRFGFEIVAAPFALAVMLMIGERRVLWLGVGAVAMPLAIWFAVAVLLGRPLP